MKRTVAFVAVTLCSALLAVAPAAIAHADCTGAGDFGAGSGCPPPGDSDGSGGGESWPPTSVDWPPSQSASSTSGSSAGGGGSHAATVPIVMPDGQTAPQAQKPTGDSTGTSASPIVPVGAPAVVGPAGADQKAEDPIVIPAAPSP